MANTLKYIQLTDGTTLEIDGSTTNTTSGITSRYDYTCTTETTYSKTYSTEDISKTGFFLIETNGYMVLYPTSNILVYPISDTITINASVVKNDGTDYGMSVYFYEAYVNIVTNSGLATFTFGINNSYLLTTTFPSSSDSTTYTSYLTGYTEDTDITITLIE